MTNQIPASGQYFPRDPIPAYYGLDDYLFSGGIDRVGSVPSAPIFGFLNKLARRKQDFNKSLPDYPYGIPNNTFYSYKHEVVYAGVLDEIKNLASEQSPFLAYFHLFSPASANFSKACLNISGLGVAVVGAGLKPGSCA